MQSQRNREVSASRKNRGVSAISEEQGGKCKFHLHITSQNDNLVKPYLCKMMSGILLYNTRIHILHT